MSNIYNVQPQIFPPRNTAIYWDAGINSGTDAMASTGKLGKIRPAAVASLLNKSVGTTLDITQAVGWPITMPYNTARPVVMCNPMEAAWENLSVYIIYRNIRGLWMLSPDTVMPSAATTHTYIAAWEPATPSESLLDFNLRIPQYAAKIFVKVNSAFTVLPASPINLDMFNGGASPLFQLQDSQRYWGTSIEILQGVDAVTDTTNPYNVYINNLPQTALSNVSLINHPLWDAFYSSTVDNPLTSSSDLTQAQQMLFVKGLPLFNATQTTYNLITPPMIGGNMWISFDSLSDNNTLSDQFITLLQNAVSF